MTEETIRPILMILACGVAALLIIYLFIRIVIDVLGPGQRKKQIQTEILKMLKEASEVPLPATSKDVSSVSPALKVVGADALKSTLVEVEKDVVSLGVLSSTTTEGVKEAKTYKDPFKLESLETVGSPLKVVDTVEALKKIEVICKKCNTVYNIYAGREYVTCMNCKARIYLPKGEEVG